MSKQDVFKLFKDAKTNRALQQQLEVAKEAINVINIAQQNGYNFTEEEFVFVVQKMQKVETQEISEEELETVAGGSIIDVKQFKLPKGWELKVKTE